MHCGWLRVVRPEEIEMELTLRMPLKKWKALRKQLVEDWPSWQLSSLISSMVMKAEKEFEGDEEIRA